MNRSILVVDDEPLLRFHLTDFFEEHGFDVHEAASADEAIAIMENNERIQIIITDIQMPGMMDGIRLAHFVRDRWPPTMLIVVSGALNPSSDDLPPETIFLSKPIDLEMLRRRIEALA